MPRLDRGIQYAAASRFHRWRLWNTGSPACAGDDDRAGRRVGSELRCSITSRHAPRKRDIQYAAASRFHRWRLGLLGRPIKSGDDG